MRGWGIVFMIIGAGSFFLPRLGAQFFLISMFGANNETLAGIFYIVLGVVLFTWGTLKRSKGA